MPLQPLKWAANLLNPFNVVPIATPGQPEPPETLYEKITEPKFLALAGLTVFAIVKLK